MSELNPHPPNPDPKNPNLMPPPFGSNDVIRTKRNTRLSGNDGKGFMKSNSTEVKIALGVKKNNKKGSNRNKVVTKEMEGFEFVGEESEDIEGKDDVNEVSDGENDVTMASSSQVMSGFDGVSNLGG